jgi:hypothetical protein
MSLGTGTTFDATSSPDASSKDQLSYLVPACAPRLPILKLVWSSDSATSAIGLSSSIRYAAKWAAGAWRRRCEAVALPPARLTIAVPKPPPSFMYPPAQPESIAIETPLRL